jgi:hypothetical protein
MCLKPHLFYENSLTKGRFYIVISFSKYDGVSVIDDTGHLVADFKSTFVSTN